jgi:hypothetical protein
MNSFHLLKLETQLNSRTQLVRYRFFAVLCRIVLYCTILYQLYNPSHTIAQIGKQTFNVKRYDEQYRKC